jgi:hypothetical protein
MSWRSFSVFLALKKHFDGLNIAPDSGVIAQTASTIEAVIVQLSAGLEVNQVENDVWRLDLAAGDALDDGDPSDG